MATNFPISKDDNTTLPNPADQTQMNAGAVPHAELHDNVNDAIKAIETKVGTGNSSPSGAGIFVSGTNSSTSWSNLYGDVTSQGTYTTLATTGVVPGSYSNANITVDAKGRIISAATGNSGSGGGGGVVSPLTTKGDIWVYSNTNDRQPVGTNGQVLTADSTQSTGLKWAAGADMFKSVYDPANIAQQIVGTSATQNLSNKNLTSATNTFPTFNQNTTGSAATLTTPRAIQTNLSSTTGANFDGSANITPGVTGTLAVANGGTGATTATGTGAAVLATSPTFTTPNIGAATGTSLNVSGQLTSTVATGTAPLVVSSTTKVNNLNASSVNGIQANGTATAGQLFPLQSTSTDANGWTVYNYGLWKEYRKQTGPHSTSSLGTLTEATLTTTQTMPVGTVPSGLYMDVRLIQSSSGSRTRYVPGTSIDPTANVAPSTFAVACRNITGSTLTDTDIYLQYVFRDK